MRRAMLTATVPATAPAIAFSQALLTGTSKLSGTSLTVGTGGAKTITAGKHIFVAYAEDPGTTSAFSVTDNLGNTYTEIKNLAQGSGTGGVRSRLFRAPITTGGSLTSISISWTGAVIAKAAAAGEYTNVGALSTTDGYSSASANGDHVYSLITTPTSPAGGAVIFTAGAEAATTYSTPTDVYPAVARVQAATSGLGTATNISVALCDRLTTAAETYGSPDWPYIQSATTVNSVTATAIYAKA